MRWSLIVVAPLLVCVSCAGGGIVEETARPVVPERDTTAFTETDSGDPPQFAYYYWEDPQTEQHRTKFDVSELVQEQLPTSQRLSGDSDGGWCRFTRDHILECWSQYRSKMGQAEPRLTTRIKFPDSRLGSLVSLWQYDLRFLVTYPTNEIWLLYLKTAGLNDDAGAREEKADLVLMKDFSDWIEANATSATVEVLNYSTLVTGTRGVRLLPRNKEMDVGSPMHSDLVYDYPCTLGPQPRCFDPRDSWSVTDLPSFADWTSGRSSWGWKCEFMGKSPSLMGHGAVDLDENYADEGLREKCQPTVPESLFPRHNGWPARTPTCLWTAEGELHCFDFDEQRVDGEARVTQLFGAEGAPLGPILEVSMGPLHLCVLGTDHHVRCVGRNDHGELGSGTADDQLHVEPVEVAILHESPVEFIRTHGRRTCALHADDEVTCWGSLGEDNFTGPTLVPFETMERVPGEFLEE